VAENKLTKADIVERIHEKAELGRKDIQKIVDLLLDELKNALVSDNVIELRGFGTFEIKTRKGREKARNPKTGEIVSVKNHGVAVFRSGKELKNEVWKIREN
jgi:integration host factor subunit beta